MAHIPFARTLPARGVATIAVAWLPATALMNEMVLVVSGGGTSSALLLCGWAFLVQLVAAHLAFASRSSWRRAAWLVVGTLLSYGSDLGFWAWHLASGIPSDTLHSTIAVYAFFGPVLRTAYCLILCAVVSQYLQFPSDENADHATVVASVWLALPWLTPLTSALLLSSRTSGVLANPASVYVTAAFPLSVGVFALVRTVLRRRWLDAIERGEKPNWRLVEDQATEGDCRRTLTHGPPGTPAMVLLHAQSVHADEATSKWRALAVVGGSRVAPPPPAVPTRFHTP
jgi:hypothetical protein